MAAMAPLAIAPLSPGQAAEIQGWRYPGRYATYDVTAPLSADDGYFAVCQGEELVGYCCYGAEARVPGVAAAEGVLDIGWGMRPELTGQGRGHGFVSAIVAFGRERYRPRRLRVSILRWNARSRAVAAGRGFVLTGSAGDFDVLERDA